MRRRRAAEGFTLIELLIAVAVLGIIAAIAIPNLLRALEKGRIARLAADLRTFEKGFLESALDADDFPPDSHLETPYPLKNRHGTESYLPIRAWLAPEPFGGISNRDGPDFHPHAGISLHATSATVEQAVRIDEVLDDGDLATGSFRLTANDRYTWIIDE